MPDEQTHSISTEDAKKSLVRQLNGTSFLTLEHVGYFVLVVLLPVLLVVGATTAMELWSNSSASSSSIMPLIYQVEPPMLHAVDTTMAVAISAALLVLVPLLYVLRRRTAAEYVKRPGYANRVAYKLPMYTALGLLVALSTGAFISMLSVFLNSLVNIGVNGVHIGELYTQQFLPALLSFAVFGMACWYVAWLTKGKDTSKLFVNLISALGAVMVIALFVTALTQNHDTKTNNGNPVQIQPYAPQDNLYRY